MVDRIRWDTVSYLPFYYVFFQFLLLTIFNLQANILTTKDILSNLARKQTDKKRSSSKRVEPPAILEWESGVSSIKFCRLPPVVARYLSLQAVGVQPSYQAPSRVITPLLTPYNTTATWLYKKKNFIYIQGSHHRLVTDGHLAGPSPFWLCLSGLECSLFDSQTCSRSSPKKDHHQKKIITKKRSSPKKDHHQKKGTNKLCRAKSSSPPSADRLADVSLANCWRFLEQLNHGK